MTDGTDNTNTCYGDVVAHTASVDTCLPGGIKTRRYDMFERKCEGANRTQADTTMSMK